MFSPSPTDVRAFFKEARRKRAARVPASALETIAADWIDAHPEYATDLDDPSRADAAAGEGRENPFLHLSMHLAISEQLQIDQPPGLKAAYQALVTRLGSPHAAQHAVMECLGETLWRSQRDRAPPDGEAYLECVRRRAGG